MTAQVTQAPGFIGALMVAMGYLQAIVAIIIPAKRYERAVCKAHQRHVRAR